MPGGRDLSIHLLGGWVGPIASRIKTLNRPDHSRVTTYTTLHQHNVQIRHHYFPV